MEQVPNQALDFFKASEVELIYRSRVDYAELPRVLNSKAAYEVFKQNWDYNKIEFREQFKIMLLNRASICLGISDIGIGGPFSCFVDKALIFATALKSNATSIILAHNHPSGNLQESHADIDLTKKIIEAGKLFDIAIADHLIMTANGYSSFMDRGKMPSL